VDRDVEAVRIAGSASSFFAPRDRRLGLERRVVPKSFSDTSWPDGIACPSITRSAIAGRLIALRDRAAHAHVEQRILVERLAVLGGDERARRDQVVEVEVDHAVRDLRRQRELRDRLERARGRRWAVCSIASTSPDSSAAMRAGSFLMILNWTFS
jgi:hypothetical protein